MKNKLFAFDRGPNKKHLSLRLYPWHIDFLKEKFGSVQRGVEEILRYYLKVVDMPLKTLQDENNAKKT